MNCAHTLQPSVHRLADGTVSYFAWCSTCYCELNLHWVLAPMDACILLAKGRPK